MNTIIDPAWLEVSRQAFEVALQRPNYKRDAWANAIVYVDLVSGRPFGCEQVDGRTFIHPGFTVGQEASRV